MNLLLCQPRLTRTVGHVGFHLISSTFIWIWCELARQRFLQIHPDGQGSALSNFFWNYRWIGAMGTAGLIFIVVVAHCRQQNRLYECVVYLGLLLQLLWCATGMIAMESAFIGWTNLRGVHY